jgi:hypothetical protein
MFMFVNSIDASTSPPPPPPPSICLIKILEGGLKLNFKGVPFISALVDKDLKLKIETTQPDPTSTSGCTFDPIPDGIDLPGNLKPVFTLTYSISCSEIFSDQETATAGTKAAGTKTAGAAGTAASGPSQPSINLYNNALKAYHNALQNNDSNQITLTQAA